jgi:hypothetical protein
MGVHVYMHGCVCVCACVCVCMHRFVCVCMRVCVCVCVRVANLCGCVGWVGGVGVCCVEGGIMSPSPNGFPHTRGCRDTRTMLCLGSVFRECV